MFKNLGRAVPQKIFFIFFASIPIWFSVSFFPAYYQALESYTYEKAQCVIIDNKREKISSDDYRQKLVYSYQFEGREYISGIYKADMDSYSNNRRFVEKSFRKKQPGDLVDCYVNPKNPYEAVIIQGPVTPWYHMAFFIILLTFGIWGIYMSFFRPEWAEKNMIIDGDAT